MRKFSETHWVIVQGDMNSFHVKCDHISRKGVHDSLCMESGIGWRECEVIARTRRSQALQSVPSLASLETKLSLQSLAREPLKSSMASEELLWPRVGWNIVSFPWESLESTTPMNLFLLNCIT